MANGDMVRGVVTLVAIAIVLLAGVQVMDATITASPGGAGGTESVTRQPVALDGAGTAIDLAGDSGTNEVVYNSTGYALQLNGSNASVSHESNLNPDADDDQAFTVCQWGALENTSAARQANRTLFGLGDNVVVSYKNQTGGDEWVGYVYDGNNGSSVRVRGAAGNPSDYHQLCVYRDGTDVRLYSNASLVDTATLTNTSEASTTELVGGNQSWQGRVEEYRSFADPLNSSERNQTVSEPVNPLTTANRTGRIYFDAGQNAQAYLFLGSPDPKVGSIEGDHLWVQTGFDGATLVAGGNYTWTDDGPTLEPASGGSLATQPAAWVDYDKTAFGMVASVGNEVADAMSLASIILLILGSVLVLASIRVFGGGM